ncbi:MAG: hypothetical protein K2G23_04705 [Muribaculaceae bacterium]|nr:hypothetical protein [Muribaculaceae bacterium]
MNKIFTIGLFAAGMMLASCDKESVNRSTEQIQTYNYVTHTNGQGDPVITKGYYNFGFDYVNRTVVLSTDMVQYGEDQDTGFSTESFAFTYVGVGGFEGGQVNVLHGADQFPCTARNGMKITALRFELTPAYYTPPMIEYDVDPDPSFPFPQPDLSYKAREGSAPKIRYRLGEDYQVYTFWPDLYYKGVTKTEVIGDASSAFESLAVGYRVKFDVKKKKAQVVLYDVKFHPDMPKMECLILPDLDVNFTNNGFEIEAANVNPLYIEGRKIMENPRFPFTTFKFVAQDNMVEGNCDFTVAGRFHGSFTGKYVEFVTR